MGRKALKILHTSDFHLSNNGDDDRESIEGTLALSTRYRADLLIIAGDLFDHNRVNEDLVRYTADSLQDAPCPVFIIAGNHDCYTPGSVYDRFDFWQDCSNIKIFKGEDGEMVQLPDLGVSMWGKSIDSDEEDVLPLAGIPQPEINGNWNIAVAHGYFVGKNPPLFPSYHITEREVVDLKWDYLALGHVPAFRCLCEQPMTYYSGSPSFSKNAALVEFSEERGVSVTRCEL
jgi:exonuclease SbcD